MKHARRRPVGSKFSANPVSHLPPTFPPSTRANVFPPSPLRHSPWSQTTMYTSPVAGSHVTPAVSPGYPIFFPSFCNCAITPSEIATHCPFCAHDGTPPTASATTPTQNDHRQRQSHRIRIERLARVEVTVAERAAIILPAPRPTTKRRVTRGDHAEHFSKDDERYDSQFPGATDADAFC